MNLSMLMACRTCGYPVNEFRDEAGTRFEHPVTNHDRHPIDLIPADQITNLYLRCHICSGPYPMWKYRSGLIEAASVGATDVEIVQTYSTQWHVCYLCAQLIDQDDADTLTRRSAAHMGWHPTNPKALVLGAVHSAIVSSRFPGRALLTTTDWPAARIGPDIMPKLRDRLTGLLRGPADLPEPIDAAPVRDSVATALDRSPLYWIDQQHTDKVISVSSSQPKAKITDRIIPSPYGLLAWPHPVGQHQRLAAVSWRPHEDGWQILGYRSIGATGLPEEVMPTLRHEIGWLVPIHAEQIPNDTTIDGRHPLGPLVTTWLLIAQELAEIVPAKVSTAVRKAYQHSRRQPPDVRIVRIKAVTDNSTKPNPAPVPASGRAKPDHRYWVTGHERNQAYGPGRTLRRKIDIDPFLKGPEDKPIKLSTTVRILGSKDDPSPRAS